MTCGFRRKDCSGEIHIVSKGTRMQSPVRGAYFKASIQNFEWKHLDLAHMCLHLKFYRTYELFIDHLKAGADNDTTDAKTFEMLKCFSQNRKGDSFREFWMLACEEAWFSTPCLITKLPSLIEGVTMSKRVFWWKLFVEGGKQTVSIWMMTVNKYFYTESVKCFIRCLNYMKLSNWILCLRTVFRVSHSVVSGLSVTPWTVAHQSSFHGIL